MPIDLTSFDDSIYEGDETFQILLSSPTNATISDGTGVFTINDNDNPPAITVNDISITE